MSKEAMKLALEALERYQVKRQDFERFADVIAALEKALAKQEQGEPFCWYDMEHGEIRDVEWNRLKPTYEGVWRPLYTTPQQRKPLTDDEIYEMYNEPRSDAEMIAFARAIEAAHGIRPSDFK